MGRREHLGELEAMVLAIVLREASANGARVHEAIEHLTGRDPSVTAIHVTLRRLEAKGLLRSRQADVSPRGGRPRRYYQLTPAGTRALNAFRATWRALWAGVDLNPGNVPAGRKP